MQRAASVGCRDSGGEEGASGRSIERSSPERVRRRAVEGSLGFASTYSSSEEALKTETSSSLASSSAALSSSLDSLSSEEESSLYFFGVCAAALRGRESEIGEVVSEDGSSSAQPEVVPERKQVRRHPNTNSTRQERAPESFEETHCLVLEKPAAEAAVSWKTWSSTASAALERKRRRRSLQQSFLERPLLSWRESFWTWRGFAMKEDSPRGTQPPRVF